ncbi:MAG: NAD(P)-dependent alcohol dehydrogenase [Candidatus Zixiibacteriota bacterium]|nr:MAG: NAD(P)-dependent alcohol dehydrogenase [candidate division Zixibacteria bacterium]
MEIHCYAAMKEKARLKEFTYEPMPLAPFDIDIEITHCGVCHSDIHLIDNDWQLSEYPLVPGHEIVGTVTDVGVGVMAFEKGERVGVGWQSGACYHCDYCMRGDHNLCPDIKATCMGNYGGFADMIRTDSRFAFAIPEQIESENAAPLLCGGITVYNPLRSFDVEPHMKVGVIGIGGLGHLALQFARAFGCKVTAFSTSPDKEDEARNLGAHYFIPLTEKGALEKAAGTLNFIISTVHVDMDWPAVLNVLKPKGKLCLVGAVANPLVIPAFSLILQQKSVVGSPIGGRMAMREMFQLAARHGIKAQTEAVPMTDVNTAVDRTRQGKARYRMVLKN